MDQLIKEIQHCTICKDHLPLGPNPVFNAHPDAKIAIIGQAPGTKVHNTGIPWNDPSGNQLRKWMNIDREQFYNPEIFAIVPMGFCYPGKGKSGDLPPRKECAPEWHKKLFDAMPNIELTLLIGQYAQQYYLGSRKMKNLTETVKNYQAYLPEFIVTPHPSPRNRFWLQKNPWFEDQVIPVLQHKIKFLTQRNDGVKRYK